MSNFQRTFGTLTSPVPLSYLDDNFGQIETASTSTVSLSGAALVGFIARGASAVSRNSQDKERDIVSVKDFGVAGDATDEATEIQAAITYVATIGADLYFPCTSAGYKANTGLTAANRIGLRGDANTFIATSSDITLLHLTASGAAGSVIDGIEFIGPGTASSTKPGIKFTNVSHGTLRRVRSRAFDIGLQLVPGGGSCFLNSLYDCRIEANGTINIDAQSSTNALSLFHCTIGGSPCATGLKLVDSNSLNVCGGDAESLSLTVFDLDATSELQAGHTISAFHFENNTSSAGDVRIGNTAAVNGVSLLGNFYKPDTGNDSAINAVNGKALCVRGGVLHSGYTGVTFQRIGASFGSYSIEEVSGVTNAATTPTSTAWTPTDGSGAGLTFASAAGFYTRLGNMIFYQAIIVYPATADGSAAQIGGLPVAVLAGGGSQGRAGGNVSYTTESTLTSTLQIGTEIQLFSSAGAAVTNATLSGDEIYLSGHYFVA